MKNCRKRFGANFQGQIFFYSIGNSSGFPIEEKNNDAQLAGVMFIAAQSARARRMRIAHSFLSYRRYSVKICDFMKKAK